MDRFEEMRSTARKTAATEDSPTDDGESRRRAALKTLDTLLAEIDTDDLLSLAPVLSEHVKKTHELGETGDQNSSASLS